MVRRFREQQRTVFQSRRLRRKKVIPVMFDKLHEECGVFGIFGHPDAANLTYLGLYALQHRGQESAGIVSSDGKRLYGEKAMGLVADIFNEDADQKAARLHGHRA